MEISVIDRTILIRHTFIAIGLSDPQHRASRFSAIWEYQRQQASIPAGPLTPLLFNVGLGAIYLTESTQRAIGGSKAITSMQSLLVRNR
jgi:hypothetical protein